MREVKLQNRIWFVWEPVHHLQIGLQKLEMSMADLCRHFSWVISKFDGLILISNYLKYDDTVVFYSYFSFLAKSFLMICYDGSNHHAEQLANWRTKYYSAPLFPQTHKKFNHFSVFVGYNIFCSLNLHCKFPLLENEIHI